MTKPKVLISWSGDTSKEYAACLNKWLPATLQTVEPYFSPEDIEKGSIWFQDLHGTLKECSTAIFVITPESLDKPWLMFELGAVATKVGTSKAIPILFDVSIENIKPPLSLFNVAPFSREEILKVLNAINGSCDDQLPDETIRRTFQWSWEELEREIEAIRNRVPKQVPPRRSDSEILRDMHEMMNFIVRYLSTTARHDRERDDRLTAWTDGSDLLEIVRILREKQVRAALERHIREKQAKEQRELVVDFEEESETP